MFSEEWCWSTENYLLPTELRREALQLQKLVEYDDEGAEGWCFYGSVHTGVKAPEQPERL